jgi:ATP-binding cassette, subfamily B, bacterial
MKSFPIYQQRDMMDCGPTCLRMIAAWHGRQYGIEHLRMLSNISREGVSLLGVTEAAEKIGLRSLSVRLPWKRLRDEVPLPCIAHWEQNHFVVVHAIRRGKVHVADPQQGRMVYSVAEFLRGWLPHAVTPTENDAGILMLLEPSPSFYEMTPPKEGEKPGLGFFFTYLRPHKRLLVQLAIGMSAALVLDLLFPFLTQSVVDHGIGNLDLNLITLLLAGQMMLVLGQTVIEILRSWILLHAGSRVSTSLVADFLHKMLRLPLSFFDTRSTGDIMQRINDHDRIRRFLTSSSINMAFSVLSFAVFGIVLAFYNWTLLAVFLVFSALTAGWLVIFMKQRRMLDQKRFTLNAKERDKFVEIVGGVQEIKLQGIERRKRWEWEDLSVQNFRLGVRSLTLKNAQSIGLMFLGQLRNILITFLSARAVIRGDMTLGMMLGAQYIVGQLNAPVQALLSFIHDAQDARLSLERMGEIWAEPDEEDPARAGLRVFPENRTLTLSNLCFRYPGAGQQTVLNHVDLIIPEGRVTAIVGPSGSGKTTLLKLLLGLHPPGSGAIYLGHVPLTSFDIKAWRQRCGVVMQDGFVFPDTIARNVACDDAPVDPARLHIALQFACLDEWVEGLPLGAKTRIGDDGQGLSGGQKQRLLMARAIYRNPEFIFLDEATSSLDAQNEQAIMNHLRHFLPGRTAIIVAHRLSTVRNADHIVVLDAGRVVEQGTHQQLVRRQGLYFNLVRNQLDLETQAQAASSFSPFSLNAA